MSSLISMSDEVLVQSVTGAIDATRLRDFDGALMAVHWRSTTLKWPPHNIGSDKRPTVLRGAESGLRREFSGASIDHADAGGRAPRIATTP